MRTNDRLYVLVERELQLTAEGRDWPIFRSLWLTRGGGAAEARRLARNLVANKPEKRLHVSETTDGAIVYVTMKDGTQHFYGSFSAEPHDVHCSVVNALADLARG